MGFRDRLRRASGALTGPAKHVPDAELHVGDPRYDDWAVVRDFEEIGAARAWRQPLRDQGIPSVLTADWPLDEFGRGDIALRVPQSAWPDASELFEEPSPGG